MTKVAKLVYVSFITRVVVDENATDDQIIEAAKPNLYEKVRLETGENLEKIEDDTECPYGIFNSEVETFYQPETNEEGMIVGHEDEQCFSIEVWKSKELLMQTYPNCKPLELTREYVENPCFID